MDDYTFKHYYDGHHIIAEYDGENSLLRKYIFGRSGFRRNGPRVDELVCMSKDPALDGINVQDNNSVCYYHFDGLGSVIALSDPNGDTVQTHPSGLGPAETDEYSVYGEVAAEDVNHPATARFAETSPNPIMFTGCCPRNPGQYTIQQIHCPPAHKKMASS